MINRVNVLQFIIDNLKAKVYLEIGVETAETFLKIKAPLKLGVDPNFIIPKDNEEVRLLLNNDQNKSNKYFEMSSDDFFEKQKELLTNNSVDVAFIDGLHTFKQSLKDTKNTLRFLSEKGIIVLHDCNPPNKTIAYPAESIKQAASLNLPGWKNSWSGDVWKTIPYLRASRKDLNIFVLNCDWGLGIISKGKQLHRFKYSSKEVEEFTYSDLKRHRKGILNLKKPNYIKKFLSSY